MNMTRLICPEHGPLRDDQLAPGDEPRCACGRPAQPNPALVEPASYVVVSLTERLVVIPYGELHEITSQCSDPDTRLALWPYLEAQHADR